MRVFLAMVAAAVMAGCAATITHTDGTVARIPWPMQYAQRSDTAMWMVAPADRSVDALTTVALKLAASVPEAMIAAAERAAKNNPSAETVSP